MAHLWRKFTQSIPLGVQFTKVSRCIQKQNFATTIQMDDDGDPVPEGMKTKVTILNQEDTGLFVDAYSPLGFRLNTGVRVMGPCAIFPRSVLHWNVRGVEDVNEDSLSLFTMLVPKLEILILGVGEKANMSLLNSSIVLYLRSHKINVEVLTTQQALPTFNFLNSEKRYVAGAFIPPNYLENDPRDDQLYYTNLQPDDDYKMGKDFFLNDPVQHSPEAVKESKTIPKIAKEQRKVFMDKYIYQKHLKDSDGENKGDRD